MVRETMEAPARRKTANLKIQHPVSTLIPTGGLTIKSCSSFVLETPVGEQDRKSFDQDRCYCRAYYFPDLF